MAESARRQGRIAGFTYLGVVVSGIFSLAYAPHQLIELAEPAITLANIQAQVPLFLGMIASGVVMAGFFAVLPFTLSRFLAPHGLTAARLMVTLALASLPFTLLAFWHYAVLCAQILSDSASTDGVSAARAGFRYWLRFSIFFWGAWLAPLGWLIFRSAAIPRLLGAILMIGSVGYIIDLLGPMLVDGFGDLPLAGYVGMPATIGELGTCLWLVLFGARAIESTDPAAGTSDSR